MLNLNLERINEILANLDRKNMLMLYFSIFLIFVIIIFFIYDNFDKKLAYLNNEFIKVRKRVIRIKKDLGKRNIKSLKYSFLRKKSYIQELEENLKYLNSFIYTSNLYIDNKTYLNILSDYLKVAPLVNASFEFNESFNKVKSYNIKISGYFNVKDYFDFINFIKTLEGVKGIVTIDNLILKNKNRKVLYDINVSIWSIK